MQFNNYLGRNELRKKGWTSNLSELEANLIFEKHGIKSTKRGYPDFSILKDDMIVGFVEVKPNTEKKLKVEQETFGRFCKKHNFPYLRWSPDQGQEVLISFIKSL